MERGCILTGGSAGAICWFHSGHSDSADPDSYVDTMLQKYGGDTNNDTYDNGNSQSEYLVPWPCGPARTSSRAENWDP